MRERTPRYGRSNGTALTNAATGELTGGRDVVAAWAGAATRRTVERKPAGFMSVSDEATKRISSLRQAFSATGGIMLGDEVCFLIRPRWTQPISVVARWIVNREVVSFEGEGQTWLPLFQFDLEKLSVTPLARQVIEELRGVFDDQELTDWFAAPNSWLDGASPADELLVDGAAVLEAARADRFVAAG